ncbi:MAG TPA: polysaccharide deacetylase family protein [Candidatus Acidoferrum sp.]|nr:polysaccharide deacetylase family protein [Candidatus Acidoferrum sp.]
MNPFLISVPAAVLATSGVAAYGAVYPRAQLFGPTVCRTNSARKLAITFDDGPNPASTPQLLDLLDRYQAKATFFVIGRFVRECPELVKETAGRGHVIGNHTDTHRNLTWLSPAQVTVELRLCHRAISNAVGVPAKWFRPPYGFRNPWVIPTATELGCKTAMWTLIPGDWLERPTEWLIRRMQPIASHAKGNLIGEKQIPRASTALGMTEKGSGSAPGGSGDVLCLHDGYHREMNCDRTRTLTALEHWLPRWRDLGLQFVTMDEAVR